MAKVKNNFTVYYITIIFAMIHENCADCYSIASNLKATHYNLAYGPYELIDTFSSVHFNATHVNAIQLI